jgi:hypothetical protein
LALARESFSLRNKVARRRKEGDKDSKRKGPGQGHRHHRPPPLPIVEALDANHDGIIDSNEIANASAALLTLDKNHDGSSPRTNTCRRVPTVRRLAALRPVISIQSR